MANSDKQQHLLHSEGLFPSATYFQQTITEVFLPSLICTKCEDYIDDLLIVGFSEIEYLANLRQLFERLKPKKMSLSLAIVKLAAS